MTADVDLPLDEQILCVFEEQEEQFFYPITSQNEARSFLKALNSRGVSYDAVCTEISEFEHNFSAWRKGLGRVGIGKRVIQRINQPLYDVLQSDDEGDDSDLSKMINRIKQERSERAENTEPLPGRPDNDRVPPITAPTTLVNTEETRILTVQGSLQRSDEEASKSENTSQESSPTRSLRSSAEPGQDSDASANSSPTQTPRLIRGPKKLPGAELAQNEPGVVDFRSVLKRRSHLMDDKAPPGGAGDRRSMPPNFTSLEEIRAGLNKTKVTGSVDRINSLGSNSSNNNRFSRDKTITKENGVRAISEPRTVLGGRDSSSSERESTTRTSEVTKTKSEDTTAKKPEEKIEKTKSEDLETKRDLKNVSEDSKAKTESKEDHADEFDTTADTIDTEPLPETAKVQEKSPTEVKGQTAAPLAAEEIDEDFLSSASSNLSSELEENDEQPGDEKKNGEVEEHEEEESEEDRIIPEPNYDSDLDNDHEQLTREGQTLARQIIAYKAKVAPHDGPGYLYVFKDRLTSMAHIGASRMPKKRLSQALCYNTHLDLVSALPVSLRKTAAQRARGRLARFQVKGQEMWFEGPMDEIIRVVTSTAERYPKNSSEC